VITTPARGRKAGSSSTVGGLFPRLWTIYACVTGWFAWNRQTQRTVNLKGLLFSEAIADFERRFRIDYATGKPIRRKRRRRAA
jgi:hypothetical protein